MSHKLIQAFEFQAVHCAHLNSPFMARWCKMFAKYLTPNGAVGTALFNWQGDVAAGGDNVPLRLMGALHKLVMFGMCPELTAVYPPHYKDKTGTELWAVAQAAFTQHADFIFQHLKIPPQTNEVRRSGILLPGFLTIAEHTNGLPFVLSELGASAGLNLNWDLYHYTLGDQEWGDTSALVKLTPDWRGPVPKPRPIDVQEKRGCDLKLTDLSKPDEVTNLLSYLWADQPERISRTKSAIETTHKHPYMVDEMNAYDWLKQRLETPYPDAVHVIYHTIAWQYFPDDVKQHCRALIITAGAKATKQSPLAWLGFEADGQEPGGALTLTIWPGGKATPLARADYHGRWVNWHDT